MLLIFSQPLVAGGKMHDWEHMHLQTDREIYIAGEEMYFKALLTGCNLNENLCSGIVYLVLRNQEEQLHSSAHRVDRQYASGQVYLHDTLPSGYYELLAYTNWMRNIGEWSFASKTLFIANRFDRALSVLNKDTMHVENVATSFHEAKVQNPAVSDGRLVLLQHPGHAGKREKVNVTLLFKEDAAETAYLSVTVAETITLAAVKGTSAARGASSTPEVSAGVITPAVHSLSAGRKLSVTETQWPASPVPPYFMERNHPILSGRLTEMSSGKPVPETKIVLNTPASMVNLLYTTSAHDGTFHFALPDAYLNKPLYLSANTPADQFSPLISLWDRYEVNRPFSSGRLAVLPGMKEQINRSQDIVMAQVAYRSDPFRQTPSINITTAQPVAIYSEPLQVIYPHEYTPFDDLQEIAREIIPFWRIRRSGNLYRSNLICAETRTNLPGSPVYFIDGIFLQDINPLALLNSEMLERIEMHNIRWVFGEMEFMGIIGLFTKGGEYLTVLQDLPFTKTSVDIEEDRGKAIIQSHEEKEISHESPDLRQLLYWDASLELIGGQYTDITFFTGDLSGEFVVRAEGITSSGKKLKIQERLTVP